MPARRLPAEWETQSGIMLTWPHSHTDWNPILTNVEPVFVSICAHTSQHEKVLIVARDTEHKAHIQKCLSTTRVDYTNIKFGLADSNDSWARDHGAISVMDNEQPVLLDFNFNAWGGKYEYHLDNEINEKLQQQNLFHAPLQSIDFVLEGGSIESNGEGTLLTNQCLLSCSRNPGLDKAAIESTLKATLGIQEILWLKSGELIGDDTDAHIDTLARFVNANKIAYVGCDDKTDAHYQALHNMEQELKNLNNRKNEPYELIPLPLPDPIHNKEGQRLPATYANFLIINDAVLLPVYNQEKDYLAYTVLQKCFPGREIITINCLPLIHQYGSLHCVTMQFPKGILL